MNAVTPVTAATRETFTAFVCDEDLAATVRAVLPDIGWSPDQVMKGGLHNAVQTLSVTASPIILLVDLSEAGDPLNDINALAEVCEPGTIVLAAGTVNDVRLYRDLIASGIQDYLVKPVTPDMMRDALFGAQAVLQAPRQVEEASDARPHVGIAVIGTRGGVGASTIATSLAWMFADEEERATGLLDLDVQFGTGALAFDLEPGRGLTDALENPSRIDGLFIERAMTRVNDRLAVLSAEAPINQPLLADGTALHQLEEEMSGVFDALIVDMPRSMAVQHPQLLGELSHVVLVTEQSLAATRDTIRILGFLRANAPQAKVTVVANKVSLSPAPEVSKKDFEASIEREIDIVLPLDVKQAIAAAKQGKALPAVANGRLSAALNQLLKAVSGASGAVESGPHSATLVARVRALLPARGKTKAAGTK
ncbi:AAA family ATPase [Pacificimonas flava]|uniref:Type II/IV secretion system ATPase TadZ/CpaE, associated with Flp pilus assembly n=1 Tax=Pacificimonas flava TaxID=1234595 RepID=M2U5C5_9SPHN|nr:P-loop NTPase [Pacificimonas flava]EMD83227.1 Type II/IV secretion system ATPase TadZ/CpaE, associated with Flp pilus assembly [Pacificimonas flava]MBB5279209.1 pilus assembly protein CpaE [Pacificimonas flava]